MFKLVELVLRESGVDEENIGTNVDNENGQVVCVIRGNYN